MAVATITGADTVVVTAVGSTADTTVVTSESGTASANIFTPGVVTPAETIGNRMRIVFNNAADRIANLATTSAVGSLVVTNLLNDYKTEVWRASTTNATLTATWSSPEMIGMVAFPFSNFSPTATVRVQAYTNAGDSVAVKDTGNVLACPAGMGYSTPWLQAGVNQFGIGGGVYAAVWFAPVAVQKIVVTIIDTNNPSGYIEASRLVTGNYWVPERNVEWESPKITNTEDTTHERSDVGACWTDRGMMYKKLTFDLSVMTNSDRNYIWTILRAVGMSRSIFISLVPESADAYDEQMFTLYGRLSGNSTIQYKLTNMYATSLTVEEI